MFASPVCAATSVAYATSATARNSVTRRTTRIKPPAGLFEHIAGASRGDVAIRVRLVKESRTHELARRLVDRFDEPGVVPVSLLERTSRIPRRHALRRRLCEGQVRAGQAAEIRGLRSGTHVPAGHRAERDAYLHDVNPGDVESVAVRLGHQHGITCAVQRRLQGRNASTPAE